VPTEAPSEVPSKPEPLYPPAHAPQEEDPRIKALEARCQELEEELNRLKARIEAVADEIDFGDTEGRVI
jgi:hypothetical protein